MSGIPKRGEPGYDPIWDRLEGKYYDRQGEEVSMRQWAERSNEYRRVGETFVGGSRVSTVHLGLNHQYGPGPPLIFETMVFGGPLDQEQERYSTEEEAVAGHAAVVERVKEAQGES